MSQAVPSVLRTVSLPHEMFPSLDTPFSKYSSTNYAASELEFPAIHEIISQRKNQIKDIDFIIEGAEVIANQFHEMREQVVSSLNIHEGFISCIRRLPPEILGEIFMQCLHPGVHVRAAVETAPLLLTRLCRRWRTVALDTPRLWCSLSIDQPQPQQLSFYHDWLKNAKSSQLSFNVRIHSLEDSPSSRRALLEFLRHYTRQLVDLIIRFDEVNHLDLLFKDVPILERLCLVGNMIDLVLKRVDPISIAQPQPRLRTLIIHAPFLHDHVLSGFNPGWTNITHLDIALEIANHIFFTILEMCPNLERFFFDSVPDFNHANPVSLTHSALRVLKLVSRDLGGSFSDRLLLPNLRSFQVDRHLSMGEHSQFERETDHVFNLDIGYRVDLLGAVGLTLVFNPGWSDLRCLKLEANDFQIFLRLLQLCPNLEDAVVSSIGIDSAQLEYLLSPVPITHSALRSLSMRNLRGPIQNLPGTPTLPSLCHISVSLDKWYRNWSQASGFREFISRSQCPLESLSISAAGISIEGWEEFPSLIPSLRCLELYDIEKPDANVLIYSWTR